MVPAAVLALAITVVLAAARIVRRQTVQFAISGAAGVALAAVVASATGRAEDFFLPGILINAAGVVVYLGSIALRRPLIGFLVAQATKEGPDWHRDPVHRSIYTRASWIWVALFSFRLSIQLPLYLSGAVAPLAIARVITGLPLFALGVWLTYLLVRPIVSAGPGGGSS